MALKLFTIEGYGQLEATRTSFSATGEITANAELDGDIFVTNIPPSAAELTAGKIPCEVGMWLAVDATTKTVGVPTTATDANSDLIGINYSTEVLYNQFKQGRNNFAQSIDFGFGPRIGQMNKGGKICTNVFMWNDAASTIFTTTNTSNEAQIVWEDVADALADGTPVYCGLINGSKGRLVLGVDPTTATLLGGILGKVTKATTNADESLAFEVIFLEV